MVQRRFSARMDKNIKSSWPAVYIELKPILMGGLDPCVDMDFIFAFSIIKMQKESAVTPSLEKRVQNQRLMYPVPNTKFLLFVLALGLMFLALTIVLNVTIQTPLFLQGVNFIYQYQTSQSAEAFRTIHNLVAYLSYPTGVAVVIVVYFILAKRRLMVTVHLIYYFFCTYLIAILVQGFQQTRPMWYDTRIKFLQWNCITSFANPSGHCFSMIVLYEPIFSDCTGYLKYKILAVPLTILWVVMPLSRMYLGMHSANQVLFGLTLGMIFLILYKYIYQKELYELCWQFLTGIRHNLKIVAVVFLHIVVLAIPIVFYLYNLANRPMYVRDLENMNKQCGVTNITSQKVQEDMFVTGCSIGSLSFGFLYGFIFLMNRERYRLYYTGKWYYERKLKIPLIIVVYIVSAGIPFLVFYLISQYVVKDSAVGDYFLYFGATTSVGIGLSSLAPILAYKWRVITCKKPSEQAKKEVAPQIETNINLGNKTDP